MSNERINRSLKKSPEPLKNSSSILNASSSSGFKSSSGGFNTQRLVSGSNYVTYEEENFVAYLNELLDLENQIEKAKCDMIIKSDFNTEDAFGIFEIDRRGYITDLDVKYGDETYKWLTDNAHKFGFSNPFKNKRTEPWHWEHIESANKMKSGAKLVEPEIDGDEIDNGLETPNSGSKSEIESSLFGDSSLEASNDESSYGLVNTFIDMVTHKENVELKNNILSEEIKRIKQLLK